MSNVDFKGFEQKILTFKATSLVAEKKLVKVSANNTVSPAASGNLFTGIVLEKKGDVASVQVGGYVEFTFTGGSPGFGRQKLAAANASAVTPVTSGDGVNVIVTKIDEDNGILGFIIL